jgi:hypothetical protein
VRNYHFIFENNDGQIELSDADEAFAFGEQVIREMMQDSSRHYEGCAIELYEGGRIFGRVPLENYHKPFSPGYSALPPGSGIGSSEKLPRGIWTCFRRDGRDVMPVQGRLT